MKAQDDDKIRRQLEVVAQWRASGQSKKQWAAANGMDAKQLMGWITYEGRWRARLGGVPIAPRKYASKCSDKVQSTNLASDGAHSQRAFAQVRIQPVPEQPSIRIECRRAELTLHWPVQASASLIGLLKSMRS